MNRDQRAGDTSSSKNSTRRRMKNDEILYVAWCPADFNAKTSHLTDEARSAYRELLDFAFLHGRNQTDLPDDDRYLQMAARAKPEHWPTIRYLLFECPKPMFVKTTDGHWRNPRLAEEVAIAREKRGQAISAARTRYERSADAQRRHSGSSAKKKENKTKNQIQPTEPSVPSVDLSRERAAGRAREAKAARIARWCREHDALVCTACAHAPHMPNECTRLDGDERPCACDSTHTTLKSELRGAFETAFQMPWNGWTEQRELMETA